MRPGLDVAASRLTIPRGRHGAAGKNAAHVHCCVSRGIGCTRVAKHGNSAKQGVHASRVRTRFHRPHPEAPASALVLSPATGTSACPARECCSARQATALGTPRPELPRCP
jgi:hypothetical protein